MATAADRGIFRPLTENPFLRLATVFIFYIFEGVRFFVAAVQHFNRLAAIVCFLGLTTISLASRRVA